MRCLCCKQTGHAIQDCVNDPNFKTIPDIDSDVKRLKSISELKKTSADTLIRTTHFIKKSVMVPITLTSKEDLQQPKRVMQPFMRGIMLFDDYNYKNLNEYVLIEEPIDENKKKIDLEERLEDRSQKSKELGANRLTQ